MPSAFAPGKCILFGEHAVVFGHPAVAVAIEQGVRVSVQGSNEWLLGQPFEPSKHPHISHIIQNIFQYNGQPLDIDVQSSLFSAAGMGSSAALSNAFGAAMHSHLNPSTPSIRLDWRKWLTLRKQQPRRAGPVRQILRPALLGGCVVVSGQHVTGTRHVFRCQLGDSEADRGSGRLMSSTYLQILMMHG